MRNPILSGFHADPCICRRGDDYFIAVSSFEWFPGVPVYHSRDLKNWELYTHILTEETQFQLIGLPSGCGVWAPCLTWCETDGLFYLVYGVMNSMDGGYFDIDNFLIAAPDIRGPWSEPVYLHSAGFDASLFHDEDNRKWITSLEWETREGYEQPGAICLVEYSPEQKRVIGTPRRIYGGGTDRGCIEAPHITRHDGWYYLMCAEGGTGYNHCVTMARSRNVAGPYTPDPENPILTSAPGRVNERHVLDFLKPWHFNPASELQKCGHGSYVETPGGEVYLVHLCSRPLLPELRCVLGRETAMQKMVWTEDGWLRLEGGGNLAKAEFPPSRLPECRFPARPACDHFDGEALPLDYYAPRRDPALFCDLKQRPGFLRIRGGESLCSARKASLVARKLDSLMRTITCRMEFTASVYQHSAGLALYYNNLNYIFFRKTFCTKRNREILLITQIENGVKHDFFDWAVELPAGPVRLQMRLSGRTLQCRYALDGQPFIDHGREMEISVLSDDYVTQGQFTGTFAGMACVDALFHRNTAEFDFFEMTD